MIKRFPAMEGTLMRLTKIGWILAVVCAVLVSAASAQTTTGTIRGRVTDAQGLALPGVTVTVTSPNLQGERNTVTVETGDFVITLLPSGPYTVSYELSGFERVQKSVNLAPMQDLPADAQLGLAGVAETITVSGSANTQVNTAQVATTFSQDLISALPTNRDLNASVLQAPAVHATGPNGAYSISGATSFESLFMVNGVSVTENLRGTPYTLYIEDAIQETTVAVSGVSAEYGRFSGGMVNVITKSGGNDFSGSFRDTYNNDRWRALSPFEITQIANDPNHTELRLDKSVPTYEYTFGGPVMKDKLWFFTAGRLQTQSSGRTLNISRIPYVYSDKTRRYEGKGTYAATSNHRIQVDYLKITEDEQNYTFNGASSVSMDERSLGTRQDPQNLYSFAYNGVLSPRLSVEARYSGRNFDFIGAGARSTDRIDGTLVIDQLRGGRFWSDTFCGVCTPESRDNQEFYTKATYFLSSKGSGSHSMVFGYDNFNDKRLANNHQSGSDYRLLASNVYVNGVLGGSGNGGATTITPVVTPYNPAAQSGTLVQYSPIPSDSTGSNFRTHSLFINDTWRINNQLTATLGLRWDKNHGLDQADNLVVKDGRFSPRLALVWDPTATGEWSVTGSVAKYVAAISNTIADRSSAAGNPQTYLYWYTGPAINQGAPTFDTAAVLNQVFAWYDAAKASNTLLLEETPTVPGLTPIIGDDLKSPYTWEYSSGVSRQVGSRVSLRSDVTYRKFYDFYGSLIDSTTGQVTNEFGQQFDLAITENTDAYQRQYAGWTNQATWRVSARTQLGGQYTLSRTWGNFDGETVNSGPVAGTDLQYPEYKQESWAFPVGDLQVDQRHRGRIWGTYGVPKVSGLSLSVIQTLESGVPYSASNINATSANGVNPRPYVVNPPFYVNPPTGQNTTYFFSARDAFRTEGQIRTDFATNYTQSLKGAGLGRLEVFAQAQVINLFNNSQLCGCGASVFTNGGSVTQTNIDTTIRTAVNTASLQPFNPFVDTPVEGINWLKGPAFGTARNRFAYTSPRQFRVTFGVRF